MEKFLNREQSKKLIELGISPDKASMVSWKNTCDWSKKMVYDDKEHFDLKPFRPAVMGFEDFDCQDIFTIGDLIELLPITVNHNNINYFLCIYPIDDNSWCVSYDYTTSDTFHTCVKKELVNALYQMLTYIINLNNE